MHNYKKKEKKLYFIIPKNLNSVTYKKKQNKKLIHAGFIY